MNFISFRFLIFFVILTLCLVALKDLRVKKTSLLIASFTFYVFWDWRCAILLFFYIVVNFLLVHESVKPWGKNHGKSIFIFSIVLNLLFLGVLKYFNFFVDNLNQLLSQTKFQLGTLHIILPLGISFFTFETLSYLIDVYGGTVKPRRSFIDYALFICFFPRIVSGPIVRGKEFFEQLDKNLPITVDSLSEGIQIILRGLLKKLVIADNLAIFTNAIFISPTVYSSATTWLAVLAYSIQILYDFSGYTDMAIGIGKIIGFDLPQNFNLPYTSQSITEFWRRWHMTLSAWFRDYLFFPLEVSRARKKQGHAFQLVNIIVVFFLTGLWHGASWGFIIWGVLQGFYIVVENLIYRGTIPQYKWTSIKAWLLSFLMFIVVSISWVMFRSPDLQVAAVIYQKLLYIHSQYSINWFAIWPSLSVPLFVGLGMAARRYSWKWPILSIRQPYLVAVMLLESLVVLFFSPSTISPFIYFQF